MRRLLRLYPRAWRRRYETEFVALLERQRPTPVAVFDLLRGALDARLHYAPAIEPAERRRFRAPWRPPSRDLRRLRREWKGRAMLHITNGDSAADLLRRAGVPGELLPWRDILHEGPTPAGLSLEALSDLRARFIADQGWGRHAEVRASFAARDAALAGFGRHEEVLLWFEHDLYDQLQLLQILDWFAGRDLGETALSLIGIDRFPGIDRFMGLGQLSPEQIASLYPSRRPVTAEMLALAREAWAAFRAPDPTAIERVLAGDTAALPFLHAALLRHLEQFPAARSGLSRTERQVLEAIAAGARSPVEVFQAEQRAEEAPFMGDSTVWTYIHALSSGPASLVERAGGGLLAPPADDRQGGPGFAEQAVILTERGRATLAGRLDRLSLTGIDRWLGGVHLRDGRAAWRWDGATRRLVAPPAA